MPNAVRPFQSKPLRRLRGKAAVKAFTCYNNKRGAVNGDHEGQEEEDEESGKLELGDEVVTAKSGKRKRSNCLVRIQSKGSPRFIQMHIHTYIHLGCWLTHSTYGDPFTVTFAGKQQSELISETRFGCSRSLGFSGPVQLQRAAACVSF